MAGSNFPTRLKIVDDKGEMTPEFRRWLDDALAQRDNIVLQPLKEAGVDYSGATPVTITIVGGIVTQVA